MCGTIMVSFLVQMKRDTVSVFMWSHGFILGTEEGILLVWHHEVEPWFHSWYRGRVEMLLECGHTKGTILGIQRGKVGP